MHIDQPNLTKARILHLSENIGHTWSSMVHDLDMVVHTDSPTSVVLFTAAFRVFDRNQTGYVRVEDMRITIHSLGKFISHREVKELVQSALLESNTGRDDRILYNKLVRELETI
ncbi:hypothetical protein F2Q69_00024315 [Brassica cretica]|uniref:EF-hand domain-containing protein n=1 Tax=Brassica cretica TaxID=69181 RepID=A0A8S9QMK0_BRACR|nr:hypothetical protein F2Q69_00024315 [Brassica cretica]